LFGGIVALVLVGSVGHVAASTVLPFVDDSDSTTVIVETQVGCSQSKSSS